MKLSHIDLHFVADDLDRECLNTRACRRRAICPRGEVKLRAVPGTCYFAIGTNAFVKRRSSVGTGIVDGKYFSIDVKQRDLPSANGYLLTLAGF